jgi:hypothetical protein
MAMVVTYSSGVCKIISVDRGSSQQAFGLQIILGDKSTAPNCLRSSIDEGSFESSNLMVGKLLSRKFYGTVFLATVGNK